MLARVAPGKARWGIEAYFAAWERAVAAFGPGQVSTYVILGMGEDVDVTVEGCRRAIDLGVYPFVVPLRPVPGSLMEDFSPPPREAVEAVYRRIVPHLRARGLSAAGVAPAAHAARRARVSARSSARTGGSVTDVRALPARRLTP